MKALIDRNKKQDKLISRLFFSMLPVQILLFAMGFINTLVDGAMAGRFIDPSSVGVIGLYYPMVNILNAIGSVLLGGSAVICGRLLGKGDLESTRGVFSLDTSVTLIIGAVLTAISFFMPGPLATLLGASTELKHDLQTYITGYAIGIIPLLLSQQLSSFLQMERQNRRGYIGIAGMIISNVVLDVLFVATFHMGIRGLALATGISNWVYFLILAPYYFSPAAQIRFGKGLIHWDQLPDMIRIGLPGALLEFCLAMRGMVINRILLTYAGSDGLSAMSALSMVNGIFIAYCIGNGTVVRMLTSIFAGEEDKFSMRKVLRIVFTKGLPLSCVVAAVILLISPLLTGIFFADSTSDVYVLTHQLFVIYALCIPLILICQVFTNYLQAMDHIVCVSILSLFDGFFAMVIPSLILAPKLGALGVWLANPIGIIFTMLLTPAYIILYWKRIPRTIDEWMLLRPDFGVSDEDCLDIDIENMEDVTSTVSKVLDFCDAHDIESRAAYYSSLCIEEMAGNVVAHGFHSDKKTHSLNIRVLFLRDTVILRLKDDCIPFDPAEFTGIISGHGDFSSAGSAGISASSSTTRSAGSSTTSSAADSASSSAGSSAADSASSSAGSSAADSLGIRMISEIADEMSYQNLLNLNVLTITIKEKNLLLNERTDYLLEKRLRELDPDLHRRFKDTVLVSRYMLSNYKQLFPEYTDHSELHSLTVIDSCNRLIGAHQINKLNKDEIFVLLIACYLHDSGMGISEKDYDAFKDLLDEKQCFAAHPDASKADFVREHHNEFSGLFIEKYAELFELPSKEHVFAVKQVARGHRKTDLFDEDEYPSALRMPDGSTVCLPYLAAVIRLADEVDVVASRNPMVLYDIDLLTSKTEIAENRKLEAVKSIKMTRSSFILYADTDDEELLVSLNRMVDKMQQTLDLCRDVVNKRTTFSISQKKVILVHTDKQ